MASPDPSPNGDPAVPDSFEMHLEPVDPAELNIEPIPTVEAVAEMPRAGFGFWKALLWCLLFLLATQIVPGLILFAIQGPAIARRLADTSKDTSNGPATLKSVMKDLAESPEGRMFNQIASIVAPACGVLCSLWLIPRVVGRDWKRRLAIRLPSAEHFVLAVLLFFPLFVFNVAMDSIFNRFQETMDKFSLPGTRQVFESMATWPVWVLVLGVAVGPAVSEELFCRGFLGQGLVARYGVIVGILFTSLFFGFMHLNPIQATVGIVLGIALHCVYKASRSLLLPILLHFLNNLVGVLAASQNAPLLIGKSLEHAFDAQPWLFLLAAFVLTFTIGLAFYQSRVRIWTPYGTEAPAALYPHVEMPAPTSANKAIAGPLPAATVGLLVLASGLFAAIWFGL